MLTFQEYLTENFYKTRDLVATIRDLGWKLALGGGKEHDKFVHDEASHHIPVVRHKMTKKHTGDSILADAKKFDLRPGHPEYNPVFAANRQKKLLKKAA